MSRTAKERMEKQLFDFPKLEIKNKIRLIELFGGIGSQAMALRDIGADFEHYRLVEFDKYAVASYNAIHGTSFETADIRNVHGTDLGITDTDKYTYIMTYSFPCTDLSVAGKMKGMSKSEWENGNSTRSGLLWEVERILKELNADELPQVLLMENVPQVHAEQNKGDFDAWLAFLRSRGYFNFYQDLNAKYYGIPQNRDRCFCVSILSPDFIDYEFPEPVKLEKVMRDYLEDKVDEKYYINTEKAKKLIDNLLKRGELEEKKCIDLSLSNPKEKIVANAITAREDRSISNIGGIGNGVICSRVKELGFMPHRNGTIHQSNKVYSASGVSPCLNSVMGTHHNMTKIIEETRCVGGLSEKKWGDKQYHQQDRVYKGDIALAQPANLPEGSYKYIVAMRGRNPQNPGDRTTGAPTEQRLEVNMNGTSNTLTTVQKDNLVLEQDCVEIKQVTKEGTIKCKVGGCYDASFPDSTTRRGRVQEGGDVAPTLTAGSNENIRYVETVYRIRKLTPRECWRLMGYTDEDYDNAEKVNSNTQLYKQAGNAIVKQVLMAIFAQMIPESARSK